MPSEERRREILELLRGDGRVLVRDLSCRFRTSLIAIRKDLESLHHAQATYTALEARRSGLAQ